MSIAASSRFSTIPTRWELAAETIAVKIRWFGLLVGYLLVLFAGEARHPPLLNAILALGALFTLADTWYSLNGRIFLGRYPLHCHNVLHEDHAMMLRFDIEPVGDTNPTP